MKSKMELKLEEADEDAAEMLRGVENVGGKSPARRRAPVVSGGLTSGAGGPGATGGIGRRRSVNMNMTSRRLSVNANAAHGSPARRRLSTTHHGRRDSDGTRRLSVTSVASDDFGDARGRRRDSVNSAHRGGGTRRLSTSSALSVETAGLPPAAALEPEFHWQPLHRVTVARDLPLELFESDDDHDALDRKVIEMEKKLRNERVIELSSVADAAAPVGAEVSAHKDMYSGHGAFTGGVRRVLYTGPHTTALAW